MRIERVDDKTVKCFLSNEELEQYDIDYKDFILRNEKAKEVVQEIIEQAEAEVGYKPPQFAFDLQIMLLPDQGLLLTFSENPGGEQLVECLKEMKRVLQKTKEKAGLQAEGGPEQEALQESAEKPAGKQQTGKRQPAQKHPDFAVFVFSGIRRVMDYAAVLPVNLRMESELYELDGFYYLILRRGHASCKRYGMACVQAMEFAALYAAEESQTGYLKEHGSCLIAEKAVRKLRG